MGETAASPKGGMRRGQDSPVDNSQKIPARETRNEQKDSSLCVGILFLLLWIPGWENQRTLFLGHEHEDQLILNNQGKGSKGYGKHGFSLDPGSKERNVDRTQNQDDSRTGQ